MNPILDLSTRLSADVTPFVDSMDKSATASEGAFKLMFDTAKAYLGARGLLSIFDDAIRKANDFNQTIADISSITELNMEKMKKSIMGLDNIFGAPRNVGETIYELISSGVRGSEDDIINYEKVAAKTAKTIRAELYNTANAMTTMTNAYGIGVGDVSKLLDFFFLTVREGKAHGDELARTLGLVVNNAAESGVQLNELGAAIAVLSRTQSASQSMIGLNQMINSIIKPTIQAKAAAKLWNIELGASALQSKGLTNMLKELHDKVGGNVEALEAMFGNIRAGRAILSLTGTQFDNFIQILGEFEKGTGTGSEAFKKQIDTTKMAAETLQTQYAKTMIQIGDDSEFMVKRVYGIFEGLLKGFADNKSITGYLFGAPEDVQAGLKQLERISIYYIAIDTALKAVTDSINSATKAMTTFAGVSVASANATTNALQNVASVNQRILELEIARTKVAAQPALIPMLSRQLQPSRAELLSQAKSNVASTTVPLTGLKGENLGLSYNLATNNITKTSQLVKEELIKLTTNFTSGLRRAVTAMRENSDRLLSNTLLKNNGQRLLQVDRQGFTLQQRFNRRFYGDIAPSKTDMFMTNTNRVFDSFFTKVTSKVSVFFNGLSSVARVGFGALAALSAIDIGYSMGKAIAERFDFAGIIEKIVGITEKGRQEENKNVAIQKETLLKKIVADKNLTAAAKQELVAKTLDASTQDGVNSANEALKVAIENRITELGRESGISKEAQAKDIELQQTKERYKQLLENQRKGMASWSTTPESATTFLKMFDNNKNDVDLMREARIRASNNKSTVMQEYKKGKFEYGFQKIFMEAYRSNTLKDLDAQLKSFIDNFEGGKIGGIEYTFDQLVDLNITFENWLKQLEVGGKEASAAQKSLEQSQIDTANQRLISDALSKRYGEFTTNLSKVLADTASSDMEKTFSDIENDFESNLTKGGVLESKLGKYSNQIDKAKKQIAQIKTGMQESQTKVIGDVFKTYFENSTLPTDLYDYIKSQTATLNAFGMSKKDFDDAVSQVVGTAVLDLEKNGKLDANTKAEVESIKSKFSSLTTTQKETAISAFEQLRKSESGYTATIEKYSKDILDGYLVSLKEFDASIGFDIDKANITLLRQAIDARTTLMKNITSDLSSKIEAAGGVLTGETLGQAAYRLIATAGTNLTAERAKQVADIESTVNSLSAIGKDLSGLTGDYDKQIKDTRERVMSTVKQLSADKTKSGRLTNNALYHISNLLGIMPKMQDLRRVPQQYQQPVSINNAMKTQDAAAKALDRSYVEQLYAQEDIGTNVKKIVDILKVNPPINLGGVK